MNLPLVLTVPMFLVSAAIGVHASLTGRRGLLAIFKPLTTLLLLVVVGLPAPTHFAWLVVIGILFSMAGDVALLSSSKNAFMIGLVLFLVAHGTYIAGFTGVASVRATAIWSPQVLAPALLMGLVTFALLRKLWPHVAGMRGPLVVYAVALALMVVSAFAAAGAGGLWGSAAVGAMCFFVADSSLALDRFSRPIRYAPLLTLGLYWLGQLGIAVAAHLTAPR